MTTGKESIDKVAKERLGPAGTETLSGIQLRDLTKRQQVTRECLTELPWLLDSCPV